MRKKSRIRARGANSRTRSKREARPTVCEECKTTHKTHELLDAPRFAISTQRDLQCKYSSTTRHKTQELLDAPRFAISTQRNLQCKYSSTTRHKTHELLDAPRFVRSDEMAISELQYKINGGGSSM